MKPIHPYLLRVVSVVVAAMAISTAEAAVVNPQKAVHSATVAADTLMVTPMPYNILIYSGIEVDDVTCDPVLSLPEPVLMERKNPWHIAVDKSGLEAQMRGWKAYRLTAQRLMLGASHTIHYFASELPEPPQLMPLTDVPVAPVAKAVPESLPTEAPVVKQHLSPRHWLHIANANVQFSQAYISPNWYQGGENSLTLLVSALWNVKLNPAYHPDVLFENNVQYKLGLYSTPNDQYHKYNISEDQFQWNLTAGLKAFKKWYYSFNLQFKTQLLNNYGANSLTRKASFLSPGELTMGVGMTYSVSNPKRGITFKASMAPLSYNLKTCIDYQVDHEPLGMAPDAKTASEIGSSAELTMKWQLTSNITWSSRLFLFTNYKYFTGDLENTFNFSINRFLSTQIYIHGRYDTQVAGNKKGWKKWMLKEILSFGFSYSFTTVPPKK